MTLLTEKSGTLAKSRSSNPAALAVLSGGVFWAVAMMAILSGWTLLGALAFATLSGSLTLLAMALAYGHFDGET